MVRPCTPEESLKQSLIEMKLMREGGMKKRSYWDAMEDFNEEDDDITKAIHRTNKKYKKAMTNLAK